MYRFGFAVMLLLAFAATAAGQPIADDAPALPSPDQQSSTSSTDDLAKEVHKAIKGVYPEDMTYFANCVHHVDRSDYPEAGAPAGTSVEVKGEKVRVHLWLDGSYYIVEINLSCIQDIGP